MKPQYGKCGQTYELGPEYAGRRVECQCGEKIAEAMSSLKFYDTKNRKGSNPSGFLIHRGKGIT